MEIDKKQFQEALGDVFLLHLVFPLRFGSLLDSILMPFWLPKWSQVGAKIEPKNNEKKQELPKEVEKYLEYKKETKRGLNDYVKLQQDIDDLDEDSLLRNFYKENKKSK